jgi:hypothetical protein
MILELETERMWLRLRPVRLEDPSIQMDGLRVYQALSHNAMLPMGEYVRTK